MNDTKRITRPTPKERRARRPGSNVLQYLVSLAVPLVIVLFWCCYYVVLPSDDVLSVRVLHKARPSFTDTLVFVSKFADDYNRATDERQAEIEKSYLYQRLLQTGIVRRTE
jgi:hypothetical protein